MRIARKPLNNTRIPVCVICVYDRFEKFARNWRSKNGIFSVHFQALNYQQSERHSTKFLCKRDFEAFILVYCQSRKAFFF